jgi:hypothetical protein
LFRRRIGNAFPDAAPNGKDTFTDGFIDTAWIVEVDFCNVVSALISAVDFPEAFCFALPNAVFVLLPISGDLDRRRIARKNSGRKRFAPSALP